MSLYRRKVVRRLPRMARAQALSKSSQACAPSCLYSLFYRVNIPFQLPEMRRVMVIRIKGMDRPAGAAR